MALNPFFLQGSPEEQDLIQSLVNEQLKIYGVEVTYIPRKFVNRSTVFQEVESSKFDDNFQLEAYVNTWDGYSGAGDVLTKFGMSLRDELQLVISRERFEDFIAPFLDQEDEDEIGLATMRPREGDLVFFPLGGRLFVHNDLNPAGGVYVQLSFAPKFIPKLTLPPLVPPVRIGR